MESIEGNATLDSCYFESNEADDGGALAYERSSGLLSILNSTFDRNHANYVSETWSIAM